MENTNENKSNQLKQIETNNTQTPFNPNIKPKMVTIPKFQKKDGLFFILLFLGVFSFVDLAIYGDFNVGFTISYAVIFIISSFYLYNKEMKNKVFASILGVLSLAGAYVFTIHNTGATNTVLFVLVMLLYFTYIMMISGKYDSKTGSYSFLLKILTCSFVAPFSYISHPFLSIKNHFRTEKSKKSVETLIGFLIAIPFCIVIISLLASADEAFSRIVGSIFSDFGTAILMTILTFIFGTLLISFCFAIKNKPNSLNKNIKINGKISTNVIKMFLIMISIVYVVYLFSQLAYFFSAFSGILPADYEFSYAEYARRGFFEMAIIVVLNLLIVCFSTLFSQKTDNKLPKSLKVLTVFISSFSILLIATAISKMALYINTYGLTRLRVYASVIMIMLLFIVGFYIIHLFAPKVPYAKILIVICSTIFIAMCFADVDTVIAKYNVESYQSGKMETVDVNNLSYLSDGAYPYIASLLDDKDKLVSNMAKEALYNQAFNCFEYENDKLIYVEENDFRYYNRDTQKMIKVLRENFEKYKDYYDFDEYNELQEYY